MRPIFTCAGSAKRVLPRPPFCTILRHTQMLQAVDNTLGCGFSGGKGIDGTLAPLHHSPDKGRKNRCAPGPSSCANRARAPAPRWKSFSGCRTRRAGQPRGTCLECGAHAVQDAFAGGRGVSQFRAGTGRDISGRAVRPTYAHACNERHAGLKTCRRKAGASVRLGHFPHYIRNTSWRQSTR